MSGPYHQSKVGGSAPGISRLYGANCYLTINALGDSISNQGIYMPYGAGLTATYALANGTYCPVAPDWVSGNTYPTNGLCKNGTRIYYNNAGGVAGATPPTGGGNSDGTITWFALDPVTARSHYLAWVEMLSGGVLRWNQEQGYSGTEFGVVKFFIKAGGTGYVTPVVNGNNGLQINLTTTNGVVTGGTIVNPGFANGGFPSIASITDAGGGTGCQLVLVGAGGGTFGVGGSTTSDMIYRLPDCVASTVDLFVVHGGTNDVSDGTISYATIIANLKNMYETLMAAGKGVIAVPVLPRAYSMTSAKVALLTRVNKWIRAYCRGETWANPLGYKNIALADPTVCFADGTTSYDSIGGTAGTADGAVTYDGLHPNNRGQQLFGHAVYLAAQTFMQGATPSYLARGAHKSDGYDPTYNPGGNLLEGLPWAASTAYVLGSRVSNDTTPVKIYYCVQAGTSAASGGPTGTGSAIADGTAQWTYAGWEQGQSVMGCTSTALTFSGTAASVVAAGVKPTGLTLNRRGGSGSVAGTVTGTIENPWSNGQAGQRYGLSWSLGSGDAAEVWSFDTQFKNLVNYGFLAGDLGVAQFYQEIEVELSGIANVNKLYSYIKSDAQQFNYSNGATRQSSGDNIIPSSGHPLSDTIYNKPLLLRTNPIILPAAATTFSGALYIGFQAAGAAGSATATVKINRWEIRRHGV